MKLNDIKAQIDSFFDNISDEELYTLLVDKYGVSVTYSGELTFASPAIVYQNVVNIEISSINYHTISTESTSQAITKIVPVEAQTDMSQDVSALSHDLSLAA